MICSVIDLFYASAFDCVVLGNLQAAQLHSGILRTATVLPLSSVFQPFADPYIMKLFS